MPLKMLINFPKITLMTQDMTQLLRALKMEIQDNPNCSFELSDDLQKIRRRCMLVEKTAEADETGVNMTVEGNSLTAET